MKKRQQHLTAATLDGLLAALDPDRDEAGRQYERLRRRLVAFFEWRGSDAAEESADETLNVVARRLAEGEAVRSLPSFTLGVARMILLERLRERSAERAALEDLRRSSRREPSPADDPRREAFESGLQALSADSRRLILEYYGGDADGRIAARKALAERLGIPLNALRIRAFRIRAELERTVLEALGRAAEGPK